MSEQSESSEQRAVEERRRRRVELIKEFADDIATWPSWKLRATYAQPETVARAEERERHEARA